MKGDDIEKETSVIMVSLFRENMIAEAYYLLESTLPYSSEYSQIQLNTIMSTLLECCDVEETRFDDENKSSL